MDGWPAEAARFGIVAADAVLVATTNVVHLSGCDGSWFQGNGRFWSILAVAATDKSGNSVGESLFRILQNANTLRLVRWQCSVSGMQSRATGNRVWLRQQRETSADILIAAADGCMLALGFANVREMLNLVAGDGFCMHAACLAAAATIRVVSIF